MRAAFRSLPGFAKLVRDETGHILLYFTILLPVLLGFIGLSLEGGRLLMLNSQLQDLADAAALAGAKELDGTVNAIDNATDAANSMSQKNDPWWTFSANSGIQIDTDQTVFYQTIRCIPDCTKSPADVTTTDPTKAIAVKVVTLTKNVVPQLLIAVGANSLGQTSATATAMTSPVACNVQPLMLCNPFEPSGKEFNDAVKDGTIKPGMLFHMKVKGDSTPGGSGNSYAPGDFGLLDPPGLNSSGANTTRNLISQQSPNFCYINFVSPRTGEAVSKVSDGIDVRFDMKVCGGSGKACDGLDQSPAPDVLKGFKPKGGNCNSQQYDPAPAPNGPPAVLPGDANYSQYGNMFLGDGVLDGTANYYWQTHHGADWPADLNVPGQPNRWNAYRRELGLNGTVTTNATEALGPSCATPTSETVANRRIVSVAVIDCVANNVKGNSATDVRSNAYANFFITQPSVDYSASGPAKNPNYNFQSTGDVWGEFVEMITPSSGGNGKLHNIIQLIRDY